MTRAGSSPAVDNKKESLGGSFLLVIRGRRNPKRSFLRVQRERAEAEVLLFGVMKSRKQNTEMPLNASDQDNGFADGQP